MSSKNIAVFFGDETFPKKGRGRSSKKFKGAISRLATALKQLKIDYLFLPSYVGTNVAAGVLLNDLNIPYTLVIPHPNFGNMSTLRSKIALSQLSKASHKTIMLGEMGTEADVLYDIEDVTEDFVDYIGKHCNSIVVAHSEEGVTPKFQTLLDKFPDDAFEKIFSFTY